MGSAAERALAGTTTGITALACHPTRTWLVTAVSGTQAGCEVQVWDYSTLPVQLGRKAASSTATSTDAMGGYGDDGGGGGGGGGGADFDEEALKGHITHIANLSGAKLSTTRYARGRASNTIQHHTTPCNTMHHTPHTMQRHRIFANGHRIPPAVRRQPTIVRQQPTPVHHPQPTVHRQPPAWLSRLIDTTSWRALVLVACLYGPWYRYNNTSRVVVVPRRRARAVNGVLRRQLDA